MREMKRDRFSYPDILGWILLGLSGLMLLKSITLCFSADIWYDELFTVGMIEHSYGKIVALTARDVHPPLYYFIVKFVVDLCKLVSIGANTVVIAKIVSVMPYFILLVYALTFIRKRFGIFTGGVFMFCTLAMPQLSAYTVEVRMYSWALLFVTAALLHAYGTITAERYVRQAGGKKGADSRGMKRYRTEAQKILIAQRTHGAALVLYGLAAAYTQYFACVAVVMVYLYVLVIFLCRQRSRIREWFLWAAVSVLGYAPWLYSLLSQIATVQEEYWILPLTWRTLGGCVRFLTKPAFSNDTLNTVLAVILFAIYVAVFLENAGKYAKLSHNIRVCRKYRENDDQKNADCDSDKMMSGKKMENAESDTETFELALAGLWVLAGLIIFGILASLLIRPVFVYRYMIPAMGCFWLGFSVCLGKMSAAGTRRTAISIIASIFFTGFVTVLGLRNYRAFMGEEEYRIRLMQETETALSGIAPEDIVLYNFDQLQAVTSYYLDADIESYLWCDTPETLIQEIVRPYGSVEDTEQIKGLLETAINRGAKVWFLGSFNSRDEIAAIWSGAGLKVTEEGSYMLERYWFNLYEIE